MRLNHHDVASLPAKQLAVIVVRGVLAVTLPAILFSVLAGLCAGIVVRVFNLLV